MVPEAETHLQSNSQTQAKASTGFMANLRQKCSEIIDMLCQPSTHLH